MKEKAVEKQDVLPGIKKLNSDLRNILQSKIAGSLLLFDVDAFRNINSKLGIKKGDRLIEKIGNFLKEQNYQSYRVGGEEFGIIFKERIDYSEGERLKTRLQFSLHEETGVQITISGGGITHPGNEFGFDTRMSNILYSAAEQLLITAKKQGRDKIVWFPSEPVRSLGIMNAMVRFYRELAMINSSDSTNNEEEFTSITGLPNSREFERTLTKTVTNMDNYNDPLSLLIILPESMEEIQSISGNSACERYIIDIARILKDVVRASDYVAHLDNNTFAILLEKVDSKRARILATRLQNAIAGRTEGTVSIGIYSGIPLKPQSPLESAKKALNRATSMGKNQIVVL